MFTEKEIEYRCTILLSAQQALLGVITPNVRAVTIDFSEKYLYWRIYFDKEPSEEEKESFSVAFTEVIADFPDVDKVKEEYLYYPYPKKMKNIKELVYLRWESEYCVKN